MKEEMKALKKNSTWKIVDRPKDKRAIGYYDKTFALVAKMNTIKPPTLARTCNNLMLKMPSFIET
ncbi:hypothetical protein CR513_49033, partial [Mucuna pruriens]